MDRIHVLFLDDDPDVVSALTESAGEKFQVHGFNRFDEAIPFLNNKPHIDIIVVDYHLNGKLTGLDYVRLIRAMTTSTIPCVLFTGATIQNIEFLSSLKCKVVQKPIAIPHLFDRLVEFHIEHLEEQFGNANVF